VTCEASELVRPVHDRTPVVLDTPELGETWLDPTMDGSGMRELLGPLASERLTVRPANPLVISAHNDGHHCLELQAAA
jgi:putative SOS response-associated peptidase YedK